MCSVMGCFDEKISEKDFINGFERTKSRGPDMSKVENYNGARLGFHRLAIMGLTKEGMQPFNFDNAHLVCNGEYICSVRSKRSLLKRAINSKRLGLQNSSSVV